MNAPAAVEITQASHLPPFKAKNLASFHFALDEIGVTFRFNERSLGIEHDRGGSWQRLDDQFESFVQEWISERFLVKTERGPRPLHFGRERWATCLNAYLLDRSVDPFREHLETLPAWDRTPRLEHYQHDLFGGPDGELERWVSRYLFVGAIQRTFEPGCLLREMPVLIGAQGIGKSAATRAILPPGIPGLHSDGLSFDAQPAAQVDAVRGRVIVEVSEMVGRGRAQIETLKAFVTRLDDGVVRLPYRRNPTPLPRRYILVGTTNRPDDLPNDPSGLSRFAPVVLEHGANVEAYMTQNRDQIWAEALARYRSGLRANLPRELMPQQASRAEEHRSRDEFLEDAIALLSDDPLCGGGMQIGQIKDRLGEERDRLRQRLLCGRRFQYP